MSKGNQKARNDANERTARKVVLTYEEGIEGKTPGIHLEGFPVNSLIDTCFMIQDVCKNIQLIYVQDFINKSKNQFNKENPPQQEAQEPLDGEKVTQDESKDSIQGTDEAGLQ